jgi:hypothetical protein
MKCEFEPSKQNCETSDTKKCLLVASGQREDITS